MHNALSHLDIQIVTLLDSAIGLKGRSKYWGHQTRLYDNLPELDCMTVVNFMVALEEKLNITIHYEDYNSEVFATVKSLVEYIDCKNQSLLLEEIN